MSASAFTVFDKERAKDYYGDNDACYKAVTADLKCNEMVRDLDETGWQGSLEDDEDNAITDSICSKTCHQSLQQWIAGVEKNCDEKVYVAETMREGWRQLCDKDSLSGRYCNG
jgi:hypothetical protein